MRNVYGILERNVKVVDHS